MKRTNPTFFLLSGLALLHPGCVIGIPQGNQFPDAIRANDGSIILREDLEEIANDEDLTEEDKRQAIIDLGIEDPDLIEAILEL